MKNDKQALAHYQFSSIVDVLTTFERLGIEHLEVSTERTIVIYCYTIFNFAVLTGQLNTAQTVMILAEAQGVSHQAMSERIRRGVYYLIAQTLITEYSTDQDEE